MKMRLVLPDGPTALGHPGSGDHFVVGVSVGVGEWHGSERCSAGEE